MDHVSAVRRRIPNDERLKNLIQKSDIITDITRRLIWADNTWRKEGSLIKTIIKKDPIGKTCRKICFNDLVLKTEPQKEK